MVDLIALAMRANGSPNPHTHFDSCAFGCRYYRSAHALFVNDVKCKASARSPAQFQEGCGRPLTHDPPVVSKPAGNHIAGACQSDYLGCVSGPDREDRMRHKVTQKYLRERCEPSSKLAGRPVVNCCCRQHNNIDNASSKAPQQQ